MLVLFAFAVPFAPAAPSLGVVELPLSRHGRALESVRPDAALLESTFAAAAREYAVPVELLYAIGWEASHLSPGAMSPWGGYGMFDLRENDEIGGPLLERAASLVAVNPNLVRDDWRHATFAVAALLADHARQINGGRLPAASDLDAWRGAVAVFSGRDEPNLQELYVGAIYKVLANGFLADTKAGRLAIQPVQVAEGPCGAPPPSSTDSALAYQWYGACSSNYTNASRGAGDIDMVVIHTVQGGYSSCYYWFANCDAQASAQYVIRSSDGQITQMVDEADVAWHAGNSDVNERSVGIEHEGYIDDCGWNTDAMYRASAALTADIAARQGVPLDRSHIIGHAEVPDPYDPGAYGGSGNHTDPGSCWDWDYYMSLVGGEVGDPTGEIIGFVRENDIYNTAGNLPGATVEIQETGETTTVDSDGIYSFTGIPYGNYTIVASKSGYLDGTCASGLSASQDWCSIAMIPGEEPVDTGSGTDTEVDTAQTDDSGGSPDTEPDNFTGAGDEGGSPGGPVPFESVGAGCNSVGNGAGLFAIFATSFGLFPRRRKTA